MIARISTYNKAEKELDALGQGVRTDFYRFCHNFREDPTHPGLRLTPLKGDPRVFHAPIDSEHRALLVRTEVDAKGVQDWLVLAVRHREHVYEELSVAVNPITEEIEFVDFAAVGEKVLRRAGRTRTPAGQRHRTAVREATPSGPDRLLAGVDAEGLRELGVAEQLIDLALAVADRSELDGVLAGAPLLTKDVLLALADGVDVARVRERITAPVRVELDEDSRGDLGSAMTRSRVTTHDEDIRSVLEQGDFRDWKVYLHPTQQALTRREFNGPARVSGGPGTGKTIVALHRVRYLAERLPPGEDRPILLTTFTKNLTTDLRARLSSLMGPELMARVEIAHIDQMVARVLSERRGPTSKKRVDNDEALGVMREVVVELDETRWTPEFLFEEWDQVVLAQSLGSRRAYFGARRPGRGRSLPRPERAQVWKLLERFTARMDEESHETWGQAAELAARFETERDAQVRGKDRVAVEESSGVRYRQHRYRHVVVDEGQDLGAAHWRMLRAMVEPGRNDMFIAADTHQRIYDQRVTLGALGIHIRGRSARLTLNYRSTREIIAGAVGMVGGQRYDDLDEGKESLAGYRSVLRGPDPEFVGCASWEEELARLAETLKVWREEIANSGGNGGLRRDPSGSVAVCAPNGKMVGQVMRYLTREAGISVSPLEKDGPKGNGEVHVGTMHRFKGLEYQRLAVVGVRDGLVPRTAVIERYRQSDPARLEREEQKARSLLFMAATRARDVLRVSWHGEPSPYLPV